METAFQELKPEELKDNSFKLFGGNWFLLTAGSMDSFNTMTRSWGGFSDLWRTCYVRPDWYTYEFMEKSDYYTLLFFEPKHKHREMLKYSGKILGRDVNKVEQAGITPVAGPSKTVYFSETQLVIICRKSIRSTVPGKTFSIRQSSKKCFSSPNFPCTECMWVRL